MAHTAQIAAETIATDNNGSYTTVAPGTLAAIDASVRTVAGSPPKPFVSAASGTADSWTVTVTSSTGNTFSIVKATGTGALTYPCTVSGTDRGGCPSSGFWG
jgi:hypothetical protein